MDEHEINAELEKLFGKPDSKLPHLIGKIIKVPKGGPDVERIVRLFDSEELRNRVRVLFAKTAYQENLDRERSLDAIEKLSPVMALMVSSCTAVEVSAFTAGLKLVAAIVRLDALALQLKARLDNPTISAKEVAAAPEVAEDLADAASALQQWLPVIEVTLRVLLKIAKGDLVYREYVDELWGDVLAAEVQLAAVAIEES